MAEPQTIPARHGVATFVPAGQVIKIINTSGSQVIDTWAFALPKPEPKKSDEQQEQESKDEKAEESAQNTATPQKKKGADLPSQEDAEKATQGAQVQEDSTPKKNTWSSYVPSLGLGGGKKSDDIQQQSGGDKNETEQQKNSKTWSSYFTAGKGFTSYIPKSASDAASNFATMHERDRNKTYMQQLQDLSKTPVGAAGYSGMAAMTGSGYAGSLYAGYQAWNAKYAANAVPMEFMSMPHCRAASLHMIPQVDDTMVTNLREPILTLIEDKSPGIHDTLIAACDPARYKGLGVSQWEEHGSCAENLVLALKELNERAGLKGAKAVGADITVNSVPAPLNLFMNIPWDDDGDIGFKSPKTKPGDYVRLRAERDTVVVMSACPQDILDINNKKPTDASFIVEETEDTVSALKRASPPKKKTAPPRKAPPKKMPATTAPAAPSVKPSASAPPKKKPIPPAATKTPAATAPAQKAPAKKATQPVKPAASTTAAPAAKPKKKPIPPSTNTSTNGEATPVAKKAPRKLARPQASAAGAQS